METDSDSSYRSADDSVAVSGSGVPAHTPGPWIVGGRTPMRPAITVYHRPFGLCDVAEVYEDADALLIAAAPDLLSALRLVSAASAESTSALDFSARMDRVIDSVRAAIALATGAPHAE